MDDTCLHAGAKCDFATTDGTWLLYPPMSTNLVTTKIYEVTMYTSGLKTETIVEGIKFDDYTANTFLTFDV